MDKGFGEQSIYSIEKRASSVALVRKQSKSGDKKIKSIVDLGTGKRIRKNSVARD